MGMVDRGADLTWLSQYPHEEEILFAPLTGLEVQSTRVEGSVMVVEVRLSVNQSSLTIGEVIAKMRRAHTQLLDLMIDDFKFAEAPTQALAPLQALRSDAMRHEPTWFEKHVEMAVFVVALFVAPRDPSLAAVVYALSGSGATS